MHFGILGPLEVRIDGDEVEIGSPKLRALLIPLLLNVGRTVPVERLIDYLWAGQPPSQALVSLRSYISNLRKLLGVGGEDVPSIVTKGRGYALDVDPERVDAFRFEKLLDEARRLQAGGDHGGAVEAFDTALGLWRGDALADVMYEDFAQPQIARLDELRLAGEEDRVQALLALGRHGEAIPALEAMVTAHPLRERPHAQLMVALYRAGRTPHALEVFDSFRDRLVDELGLDPSPQFVALSHSILRQAPELEAPAAARPLRTVMREEPTAVRTRLVGRGRELQTLRQAVENLRDGRGRILLIGGEAGIGKTALVDELGAIAGGVGVPRHVGRCLDADGTPPFWPWIQILRSVVAEMSDDQIRAAAADVAQPVSQLVDDVAAALGQRVDATGLDPESARFALYEAVSTFLARVAEDRGLVLILDDLHWADTTSLQLLSYLGRHVGSGRMLLAATYRSLRADRRRELDEALAALLRHDHTDPIDLAGLGVEGVAGVLAEAAGETAASDLAPAVHERTGGNAFFVRQVARLLSETHGSTDAQAATTIPTGVRHVILQRLRQLPDATRRTLDAAAVVGREFDARIVAETTGQAIDAVLSHIDAAADHGLVTDAHGHASQYSFVHALVNETVYDELPPGALARLHATIGIALEGRPRTSAIDLAEHFWRAADLIDDDRPVAYMREAAEQALAVLAYEQAASLLRRALHLLAHRPGEDRRTELAVRLRLLQLLTSVFGWTADEIEDVAAPVRSAADASALETDLLPLWWSLWTFYTTRGDMTSSLELAHTLLGAAQENNDPAGLVGGHIALAYADMHATGTTQTALEHCALARAAEKQADPEQLEATPEHLSVALRITESLAAARSGDVQRALAAADEAIEVAEGTGTVFREVYARLFAGWTAALVDDPERALTYTQPGIETSRALGFRYVLDLSTPVNAWGRARLGQDPKAQASAVADAIGSLRSVGHRHAEAQWLLLLADIDLLAGDSDEASRRLDEAREVIALTGERFYDEQFIEIEERLASGATLTHR